MPKLIIVEGGVMKRNSMVVLLIIVPRWVHQYQLILLDRYASILHLDPLPLYNKILKLYIYFIFVFLCFLYFLYAFIFYTGLKNIAQGT